MAFFTNREIFPPTKILLFGKIGKKYNKKNYEKKNYIDGEFEDIEDDNDRKI